MITVTIITDFENLELDNDSMIRDVALSVMASIRKRVHVEGKASDGSQIGNYTKGYRTVRSGQFQNNKKKRGSGFIKAGNQKGVYTKGKDPDKIGKKRIYYNRGADPKVILSLTRQMENDMSVLQIPGGYGIGYSNPDNYNKAIWNEQRYKKPIWSLSAEENELVDTIVDDYLNGVLS